tara:strand:- start:249 stop:2192 length:1944 start_codon:yes stop_codon:yes gene_type:complete
MATNVDYQTNKKMVKKDVSYLGRDFSSIRQNLIEFAKTYFPNSYNDFNEASPGMMFIEMASYVGDVLNYYVDNQFKETLLQHAEERKNIFDIVQAYGYKPSLAIPSTVELELSQTLPAKTTDGGTTYFADFDYAGVVSANGIVSSETGIDFTLLDDVNFKTSSSLDTAKVEIAEDNGSIPTLYRVTKKALAKSGTTTSEEFTFTSAKKFDKIVLSNSKVTEIVSIVDSNGNKYYEVPFLAQDTVFESIENTTLNDPTLSEHALDTPYLLRLIKTARRFTTYVREDNKMELRFGAGVSDNADETLVPNPDNVGSALSFGVSHLDTAFDPTNFMKTRTFGLAPSNTTLTITYRYGGAVEHNVRSNSITYLKDITFTVPSSGLDSDKVSTAQNSLSVINLEAASGGASEESLVEIKQNAAGYFNAQNRAVTQADYITRVYSLPQKFGNIAKAFIVQDEQLRLNEQDQPEKISNPLALNMYLLGYDGSKKLTNLNQAVKQNLKMYLSQYRIVTDAINLKNAYVINIGIKFAIVTQRGFNANDVLFKCIQRVRNHFNIDKWQIGQPIVLSDIAYQISLVDGVASVVPPPNNNPDNDLIIVENKATTSDGYSGNVYDIKMSTKNGVVYTSKDPSIFELKFPDTDIEGRVVGEL